MTVREELKTIYQVILAAARRKDLVRYSELIDLHNWPRDSAAGILGTRLDALVKVCCQRNWPAMAVIVVRKNYDRLTDNNLRAFVRGTRDAGYTVKDPEDFQEKQKEFLYMWAPTAPDKLDLSDQEIQVLFKGTRDWHINDDSLINDSDKQDNSGEANAQPNNSYTKTGDTVPKNLAPHQNKGTPSGRNNEEEISQLREEVEALKKKQKRTDKTIRELQKEVKKKHKESLEHADSKFGKFSERLVYYVLGIVAIIISAMGINYAI